MRSVLTLLLVAFFAPAKAEIRATFDEGEPPPPMFCADVQPFAAFTIADHDEEEIFGDEMGCTESDGTGPLDVEALLDVV